MIKVKSFLGKVTHEGIHQMDDHINEWLQDHNVIPKDIKQSYGMERLRGESEEPVVIITVWYEAPEEESF